MNDVAAWLRQQAEADLAAARIISNGGFAPQWWDTDPPGQVNPPGHFMSSAVTAAIGEPAESSCGWVPLWVRDQVIGEPPDDYTSGVAVLAELGRREFDHVRRHDPRTEAARAESVLAAVGLWEGQDGYDLPPGVAEGRDDDERLRDEGVKEVLGDVMRLLAYGYRYREGYREAWKP